MGALKTLASRTQETVYAFGRRAKLPKSSVYHYDATPERMTATHLTACADTAQLTDAEFGAWVRAISKSRRIKSKPLRAR
jgi:hypothetical protein